MYVTLETFQLLLKRVALGEDRILALAEESTYNTLDVRELVKRVGKNARGEFADDHTTTSRDGLCRTLPSNVEPEQMGGVYRAKFQHLKERGTAPDATIEEMERYSAQLKKLRIRLQFEEETLARKKRLLGKKPPGGLGGLGG